MQRFKDHEKCISLIKMKNKCHYSLGKGAFLECRMERGAIETHEAKEEQLFTRNVYVLKICFKETIRDQEKL